MAKKNSKRDSNKKYQKPKTRRKQVKKVKGMKRWKKDIFIFFSVLFVVAGVSFAYNLGTQNGVVPNVEERVEDTNYVRNPLGRDVKAVEKEKQNENSTKTEKKYQSIPKEPSTIEKPKVKKREVVVLSKQGSRPKLVLIIDDISTVKQLASIEALNMKITPAIFPSFKRLEKSHKLTEILKHAMIHLPMESKSTELNKQYKTLKTTFEKSQIETRIKEIRRLFPDTDYINNHTGSVFTSDYNAMKRLYTSLRQEGFIFLDSRTSRNSKVEGIAEEFGDVYIGRDVFLDNIHRVSSIHRALKQAVKVAKKQGHAIAIGHPHRVTLRALKSAKSLLKEVELVYLHEMYGYQEE